MSVDQPIVQVIEDVTLDMLAWWRQRHQDGLAPPTDAEAIARTKGKIQAGDAEGEAFENEPPQA
jgi:hypothetical protein